MERLKTPSRDLVRELTPETVYEKPNSRHDAKARDREGLPTRGARFVLVRDGLNLDASVAEDGLYLDQRDAQARRDPGPGRNVLNACLHRGWSTPPRGPPVDSVDFGGP
jgi:hypothetical protein